MNNSPRHGSYRKTEKIVMLTREDHKTYEQILREELTPAFGCTEPIALAYCAAKAREVLGQMPLPMPQPRPEKFWENFRIMWKCDAAAILSRM